MATAETSPSVTLDHSGQATPAPGGAPGAPPVAVQFNTGPNGQVTPVTIGLTSVQSGPATATQSTSTSVITHVNTPSPSTETQAQSSPDLKILLPAIVAPVVFVLILASVVLFTCLHFRNKRRERLDSGEHGEPMETHALNKKPSNSFLLPSPLEDSDRTRDGSLGVYEKRKSMTEEAAKRNTDIIGMYERPSANGPVAYNYDGEKYTTPRMPAPIATVARPPPPPQNRSPQSRTPPQSRPPPQNRAPPTSRASPRNQSPLPPVEAQKQLKPKPAPPAPKTTTQTVDSSWPLPAGGPLPSPNSMHSGKTGHSSRKSSKSTKSGGFQLPPVSTSEPFSMREALRPESDTYDLSTSAATTVPKVPKPPGAGMSQGTHPYDRTSRKRESDAISELSDRDRSGADADRLSVVSAMSGR